MSEDSLRRRIVVGVDGSKWSIEALRWAVAHARKFDADVHAVTGWDIPWTIMVTPTYTEGDYSRDLHAVLDKAFAGVLGASPEVPVERHVVHRHPGLALTDAAQGAELVVIGSHGHERDKLPGIHLGSIANYCVHHAPCPVLVIRD